MLPFLFNKNSMKKLFIPILLSVVLLSCGTSSSKKDTPNLLIISFDGFRVDYLSKTETPNFDKLVLEGVSSEGLMPVVPSKTFPNYYAIATGLNPENNGIVSNNMLDPETGNRFSLGNREAVEDASWYQGEPIWNTVEKQGKKAGTMFWVGSEAPVQDMRPSFWKSYDDDMPHLARIDSVLKWMSYENDEKKIDFGTLYFSFVDSQGHRHGTESEEVIKAIQEADELIGYLISELERLDILNNTNMMIVSDHGMIDLSRDKIVVIDDYVNPELLEFIDYSPVAMFNVKEDEKEAVYEALKESEENYKVYKKEDLPARFGLKNSQRVPDILMFADLGYTINTKKYFENRPNYPSGATHGYDNIYPEMHALFLAVGPSFKENYKMGTFENIHLYEIMAKVLGLSPAQNDGDFNKVKEMLR